MGKVSQIRRSRLRMTIFNIKKSDQLKIELLNYKLENEQLKLRSEEIEISLKNEQDLNEKLKANEHLFKETI